jgi:hypothetical protein
MPHKPLKMSYRGAGLRRDVARDGSISTRSANAEQWGVAARDQVIRTPWEQAAALGLINPPVKVCPLASVVFSQANATAPTRALPEQQATAARSRPVGTILGLPDGAHVASPPTDTRMPVIPTIAAAAAAMRKK